MQISGPFAFYRKEGASEVDSIFGQWCYVCMPRLSALLQGSTALLRARLVHVCVTEYDRATSNYLDPLHARKVARAIERQLKPIAARSLLKAASDLAPRALPQTVDQLKVSWV